MTTARTRYLTIDGRSVLGSIVLVTWMVLSGALVVPEPAAAQTDRAEEASLIERFEAARRRMLVRRALQRQQLIPALPREPLPVGTDSLLVWETDSSASSPTPSSFPLRSVRPVTRLEREWFQDQFPETEWAFLGATPRITYYDTTQTRALRARLQAEFGDPTRTTVDVLPDSMLAGRAQFEYWFVVNDSIPVQVMDPRGPRGRGLIVASQRRYRSRLRLLRDALLAPLRDTTRAPYVDYYYDRRLKRWYRSGYDGEAFFLEQVQRSAIVPGRRARLDTAGTSSSSAPEDGR